MIGGLAELIRLPAALGLVVLLCALIAALGSRHPAARVGAGAQLGLSRARGAGLEADRRSARRSQQVLADHHRPGEAGRDLGDQGVRVEAGTKC